MLSLTLPIGNCPVRRQDGSPGPEKYHLGRPSRARSEWVFDSIQTLHGEASTSYVDSPTVRPDYPHQIPRGSRRRASRGHASPSAQTDAVREPLHYQVALGGRDSPQARQAPRVTWISTSDWRRRAHRSSWRLRGQATRQLRRCHGAGGSDRIPSCRYQLRRVARLDPRPGRARAASCPFSERPAPYDQAWRCSRRTARTTWSRQPEPHRPSRERVFDIDVEHTHNFIAAGIVVHNSIYGFRGTDIKNILSFRGRFRRRPRRQAGAELPLNADGPLCTNAVVANNRGRMKKRFGRRSGRGMAIKVRELSDEHAEARYVAAEIERMVDEGVSREEIAVFYRTNAQSRVLEDMLVRAQIGYQVIGGTKFYERAEIRDAVAYLTFMANPQDAGAFTRVANSPKRGLGQTSLSRVLSHADTMGVPVWDAAAEPESVPGLGTAARKALGRFMSTMVRLRERRRPTRRSGTCSTSCCARPATTTRSRRSGRSRRRGGPRTSRSSCAWRAGRRAGRAGLRWGVPAADRADRRRRLAARRRRPCDADDAPRRQGPRVPDRVHDRHGGRRLPALARARRGRARGGAAARLRRAHPRDRDLRSPTPAAAAPSGARAALACGRASSTRCRAD